MPTDVVPLADRFRAEREAELTARGELMPLQAAPVDEERERAHQERTQVIVADFGEGLPWHPDHYESKIRGELRRGCESFVRAGALLIVARECAAHGEWQGMMERLNIEPRTAHRMMESARRIAKSSNRSRATDLVATIGSQSKLIELLTLSQEEFDRLVGEGQCGPLRLEGIDAMSRDQLRAAVREAREDIATKDERAATRERENERLQKELRKAKLQAKEATADEAATALREATGRTVLQLRATLNAAGDDVDSLAERFRALRAQSETSVLDHDSFMAGIIAELLSDIRMLRDEFVLPIYNDGDHQAQLRKSAGL